MKKLFRVPSRFVFVALLSWSLMWVGCKKAQKKPVAKPTSRAVKKVAKKQEKKKVVAKKITDKEWKAKGKKIIKKAFVTLSSNMKKAMKAGGVRKAVPFCAAKAASLTKGVGDSFKVSLSRVSHRPRNPKNQASAKEIKLIEGYNALLKAKKPLKPTLDKSTKGKVVFYAPIVLAMPVCLRCHGTPRKEIKRRDYKLIKKHYPKDKAIKFHMGELRGLWKVIFTTKSN